MNRLENMLPASMHAAREPASGSVVAARVLIGLQALPLLLLMLTAGWIGAAFLAPFLAVDLALVWLTFVRRRWSFALVVGAEVVILLTTLLAALIGLVGATMAQGAFGLWQVLFIAAICGFAAVTTMVTLWSANVHDHFNL